MKLELVAIEARVESIMNGTDLRFLIVDDTKTIRSLLKEILNRMGFSRVDEAPDGLTALSLLKSAAGGPEPVEFIICDWNMPGLNGIELLEIRNSDPNLQHVPFLMVTVENERDYVLKAVTMGVSDFLVKPFSEASVKAKISGILQRSNLPKKTTP